ncbi:hypothetical protein [Providencia alcalifaciens]|uniref:hypothetical protein n=1 Tax=Providencia alcalifaciens TaxID=126385 RepID=UPI0018A7B92A|nr:hypothetical protein [Providencia alcalifaciens]
MSVQLYDIDAILGKSGMARHVVALSLVCEYHTPALLLSKMKRSFYCSKFRLKV